MARTRSLPILLALALSTFAGAQARGAGAPPPTSTLRESPTPVPSEGAPRTAARVDEIKAWVEHHKGFGSPDFLEADVRDLHVFAAWNIPTSGWNATDYWVYCRRGDGWALAEASYFQPTEDQTRYAIVDPVKRELRFVGPKEETFKTVSLASCGQ